MEDRQPTTDLSVEHRPSQDEERRAAIEQLRDICNRWLVQDAKLDSAGQAVTPSFASSDDLQTEAGRLLTSQLHANDRAHFLGALERQMRRDWDTAYPDGLPPHRSANWLLSNGEALQHALRRCDQGTYGHCDKCRRLIDLVDLAARPEEPRCRHCR